MARVRNPSTTTTMGLDKRNSSISYVFYELSNILINQVTFHYNVRYKRAAHSKTRQRLDILCLIISTTTQ